MSNNCYFTLKAIGNKESLEEFARMMSGQGEFGPGRLGRVSEFIPEPIRQESERGVYSLEADGCCANSIYSALQKEGLQELAQALGSTPLPSLEDESVRLNIAVEAYSSEKDIGFEEHVLIAGGETLIEEDVGAHEYFVEDVIDRLEEFNEVYGTSCAPSDLQGKRLISVGGLKNYGDFSKLDELAKTWPLQRERPLQNLMDEAKERTRSTIRPNANKAHKSPKMER